MVFAASVQALAKSWRGKLAHYRAVVICCPSSEYLGQRAGCAELLFEVFSQRYERGSTIVTSNLPFDEWTGVFASERLTGALLDGLTHHVHILEMNNDSYRLRQAERDRQDRQECASRRLRLVTRRWCDAFGVGRPS